MFLFAYGSLCHPDAASATLGRAVVPRPAHAHGWERGWFVAIDNHASCSYACGRCDGLPAECLVLGIRPAAGKSVLGALIEIDEDERARVAARERSYRMEHIPVRESRAGGRVEVTAITSVPLAENLASGAATGIPVPTGYERAVADALEALATPLGVDLRGQVVYSPAPRRNDLRYVRGDGVTRGACTCEDA